MRGSLFFLFFLIYMRITVTLITRGSSNLISHNTINLFDQATQERHENSLLKSELENLQKENRAMRQLTKGPSRCPSCGAAAASSDGFDAAAANQEQLLQLENAKLRDEVHAAVPPTQSLVAICCCQSETDAVEVEPISGREAAGCARDSRGRWSHLPGLTAVLRGHRPDEQQPEPV